MISTICLSHSETQGTKKTVCSRQEKVQQLKTKGARGHGVERVKVSVEVSVDTKNEGKLRSVCFFQCFSFLHLNAYQFTNRT